MAIDKMTATRDELVVKKKEMNKRKVEDAVALANIEKNKLQ